MPLALSIGVDYDLFWRLTPRKLLTFIEAHKLKMQKERDFQNEVAWLHGIYVNRAIASAFSEKVKYPETPFKLEKESQGKKTSPAERFRAVAIAFNTHFKKKEGK